MDMYSSVSCWTTPKCLYYTRILYELVEGYEHCGNQVNTGSSVSNFAPPDLFLTSVYVLLQTAMPVPWPR